MVKSSNIDKIQSVICPDKVKMPIQMKVILIKLSITLSVYHEPALGLAVQRRLRPTLLVSVLKGSQPGGGDKHVSQSPQPAAHRLKPATRCFLYFYSVLLFFFIFIEPIGVTLVNKIVQVSGAQLHNTSSVHYSNSASLAGMFILQFDLMPLSPT